MEEAGYGVLCEIDVRAKLKEKPGVEREPYVILGACDPPLADEGLDVEPELGAGTRPDRRSGSRGPRPGGR